MTEAVTERLERAQGRKLAPGEVLLERYRIVEWIGTGSQGIVLRAYDQVADRRVAIKILHTDVELTARDTQRFIREIQAVAALRSDHVPRLYDYGGLTDGTPYMVVEALDGSDLRKLLAKRGSFDSAVAVDYVLQACAALDEAHGLGIIHRDIKPANLMLAKREDGTSIIKVLDFGCAKAPGMDLTRTGSLVGTPAYMSPEQMSAARNVDARCDIWSIGALLYHLVEGQQPFKAQHFFDLAAQVATEPHPPMVVAPHLAPVIDRCLCKDPRDRYASAQELARALVPFATHTTIIGVAPARGAPTPVRASSPPVRPSSPAMAPHVVTAPVPRTTVWSLRDLLVAAGVLAVACVVTVLIIKSSSSRPAAQDVAPPPAAQDVAPVPTTPLPATAVQPPPPAPQPDPVPAPTPPPAEPPPVPAPPPTEPAVVTPPDAPAQQAADSTPEPQPAPARKKRPPVKAPVVKAAVKTKEPVKEPPVVKTPVKEPAAKQPACDPLASPGGC